MEITWSAAKHGITEADALHAWRNAIKYATFEYTGEERVFIIGPAQDGRLLELVAVPSDTPARIIHADNLRHTFHDRF